MSVPYDRDWIAEWVKRHLGYPLVQIEGTETHLEDAIDDALRIFNRYMCEVRMNVARTQIDSVSINLGTTVRGVYDVKIMFPPAELREGQISIFDIIYRMAFPKFPVSDWYLYRSYFEMFQQVRGTEADWRYDRFNKVLYLDCTGGPFDVFYITSVDLDLTSIGLGESQYWYEFLELVLARFKMTYSQVLGKWEQVPAPGGPVMTDWKTLRKEWIERQDAIEEMLKKRTRLECLMIIG